MGNLILSYHVVPGEQFIRCCAVAPYLLAVGVAFLVIGIFHMCWSTPVHHAHRRH